MGNSVVPRFVSARNFPWLAIFFLAACDMIQITPGEGGTAEDELDVQILVPGNGGYVNPSNGASFQVSGSCEHASQIAVQINGSQQTTTCTDGGWLVTFTGLYTSLTAGTSYSLTATATDSEDDSTAVDEITLNTATSAPTLTFNSITVGTGTTAVTTTKSTTVKLNFSASADVTEIAIFNAASCAGTPAWQTYLSTMTKSGLTANYSNSFSAMARNRGGNTSACTATRSVTVDTQAPTVTIDASGYPTTVSHASAAAALASGGVVANISSVPITGTCSENGATVTFFAGTVNVSPSMSVLCAAGTYSATLDFSTLATDQVISFYSKITDSAGNAANSAAVSITLDLTAPTTTATSIQISGGASTTSDQDVTLNLSAVGAETMVLAATQAGCQAATESDWVDYATTSAFALDVVTPQAWVKFRDAALNESSCLGDTITFDGSLPVLSYDAPFNVASGTTVNLNATQIPDLVITGDCSEADADVVFRLYVGATSATGTATTFNLDCDNTTHKWTTQDLGAYISTTVSKNYFVTVTQTKTATSATNHEDVLIRTDVIKPTITGVTITSSTTIKGLVWKLYMSGTSGNPVETIQIGKDCVEADSYTATVPSSAAASGVFNFTSTSQTSSPIIFTLANVPGADVDLFTTADDICILAFDAAGNVSDQLTGVNVGIDISTKVVP
jgi:hypothetical protein